MKRRISGAVVLAVAMMLWSGAAFAQAKPECENKEQRKVH